LSALARRVLDFAYGLSGLLGAFFLAAIAVTIVGQIVARFVGLTMDSTELAGFCLAASTFLGLAYTFRGGAHIRVTLLIGPLAAAPRKWVELWCCGAGALIVGYLAWHAVAFAFQSWEFGDISPGLLAAPFWIPQSGMALGLVILTVALVDETIAVARGREPIYETNAETALE
jgi:TRAP-type C4-dicarboxylate transport system permease small subunit